ncbi:probable serine/threonine-protein phosphatase 6 regulatory ankyrin at N-terminal half [Coccomyxa sp. Obi]|nr:probable serine/threonine-protein phosphatase 6 regulatory ankyrin at N-terminal half [Coccomyxa sp. Obi]
MLRPPYTLALEIQLEEVALLACEPDQIKWSFLRSPSTRLPDTLRLVKRGTSPSSYRGVPTRKGMVTTNPLFKFGVDIEGVDADGKTALHRAAMFPDNDKVAWLLDEGLELEARDREGVTPLHCAVFYMQRAVIKVLLSRGADINTKDDQGYTPLHTAASHSSFQSHLVLADLMEAGAELEAVDEEGRTPLLVALDGNRKEAIDVLIAGGAQTSVADKKGRTALHLAVGCSSRMVEKLLLLSVTIDAADMEGRTALHYAAQKGVKATAMVLLKAGADAQATDKLGRSALDIAQEGAHIKLADFLRQWLPASAPESASAPTSHLECGSPAPAGASTGDQPGLGASTPAQASSADMLSALRTPGSQEGAGMEPQTLRLERSISRAQKIQLDSLQRQLQEVDQVLKERDSLQQQLSVLASKYEAETSQLHQEKATLQASLRLAEEGQSTMRARLMEAERRAGEAAQLRIDNAELTRSAAAARADLAAQDAAQPLIDALQLKLTSLQARNAELEKQMGEQQADRAQEAAAAAANLEAQAVRMRILQEANSALVGAAAVAAVDRDPAAAENEQSDAQPQSLARAIQGAMSSLQELPVLKDRNREPAAKPAGGKQSSAARHGAGQGENSGAPDGGRARPSPMLPGVKRVGGGYLHTPQPAPKATPLNAAPDSGPQGLPQAPEQDSDRQSHPVKSPLPPVPPTRSQPAAADGGLDGELASVLSQMRIRAAQTDAEVASLSAGAAAAGTASHEDISISSPGSQVARAQPQAAAEAARATPHTYVPSASKLGAAALLKQELVLGSPSTRASTPQSRTQKWLKDNLQRSKGPAGSGLKEKAPSWTERRESFWGSAKKSPSVASKAHKSLIDRFNNPAG